jgi:hypothetical protein
MAESWINRPDLGEDKIIPMTGPENERAGGWVSETANGSNYNGL